MHLYLDANILVDVALKRIDVKGTPLWMASTLLLDWIFKGRHKGSASILSLYILYVLVNPKGTRTGDTIARHKLRGLRTFLQILDLTDGIIADSLEEDRLMIEDALQFITAKRAKADVIVTRDVTHFSAVKDETRIATPEELTTR